MIFFTEQRPRRDSQRNFWNVVSETQRFKEIHSDIKNEKLVTLEVYGETGGGKSHIIGKLSDRFLLEATDAEKIRIQCKDTTNSVKKKFKEFAQQALKDDSEYRKVQSDIEADSALSLIKVLQSSRKHVLITIDNPDSPSLSLLKNFILLLNNLSSSDCEKKIHLYISSRDKIQLLTEQSIQYQLKKVTGFSEGEAVEFLLSEGPNRGTEEDAKDIYKRLGGNPYVLQVIKSYCIRSEISYDSCLSQLETELPYDEIRKSPFYTTYDFNFPTIFNAITKPFKSTSDEDFSKLHWKIMCCLSFLNHDHLPTDVILHLIMLFQEKDCEKAMKELIKKLMHWNICEKATKKGKETLTFFPAVFDAFRWQQQFQAKNDKSFLKETFKVVCAMVTKDMRRTENSTKMFLLRPHVETLLKHVEDTKLLLDGGESILMKALASHLYETVAAILFAESPSFRERSEECFRQALLNLFEKELVKFILEKDNLDHLQEISKLVVHKSVRNGQDMHPFLNQYTLNLDISLIRNNLSQYGSDSKCNVTEMKEALKTAETNEMFIRILKEFKHFLSNEEYSRVFYAERAAQILHSWSRVVLYVGVDKLSEDEVEWYKCLSQLSTHISKQCKEKFKTPLLCEWLSSTKAYTSILLKEKDLSNYSEALRICNEALSTTRENADMYENGFLKNAFEPSYQSTRIYFLRTMVRIFTRMVKEKRGDRSFLKEGDDVCRELVNCTTEVSNNNSVMPLIYCAKYYAARKQFQKAMECFDWYFNSLKNNPNFKSTFNVHCWAVYNYARAANCFAPYEKADEARQQCEDLLEREEEHPTEDLKKLLEEYKEKLMQRVSFAEQLQGFYTS